MARKSSIDRLPPEIQAAIARLREQGCTIDEILAHLADLHSQVTIARSSLGRHVQKLDQVVERMRHSRVMAEALARELGEDSGTKAARVNIEMLHGMIMQLFTRLDENADIAGGDPEGIMMLAKALDHLARAQKTSVDTVIAAEKRGEERARKAAAEAVESVAKTEGLSKGTVDTIKAKIFGVEG